VEALKLETAEGLLFDDWNAIAAGGFEGKHAPDLYQKYEEAYPVLVHGPLLEAHSEEQRSLAENSADIRGHSEKVN